MRIFASLLGIALFLGGCASAPPAETASNASGKPEVTIKGSPEAVKGFLSNVMLSSGYRLTKDTPYELAFDKPSDDLAVQVLLGSKYDSTPNFRVSYAIISTPPAVRVVADLAIITNPGSGFEQRTDMNQSKAAADIQRTLEIAKNKVEQPPAAIPKGKKS